MEENNKTIEDIKEMFEKNKGLKREMGPFSALVNENMSITVSVDSGWSITYPAYCETWAFIMMWLEEWSDENKNAMENFIKGVVFPCSMRISDVDAQYVESILDAHDKLTKRVLEAKKNEVDGEEE